MNELRNPNTSWAERADLYFSLGRAFLLPLETAQHEAMAQWLADDLADIDNALAYGLGDEVAGYRKAMLAVTDFASLQLIYNRVFVQPPREAAINAGIYLDGALLGGSVADMESTYQSFGVTRGEHFRDLSDHVAVQLEFVGYLYASASQAESDPQRYADAAASFLKRFVARWAARFVADIEKADRELGIAENPYLHLARIVRTIAIADAALAPSEDFQLSREAQAIARGREKWADKTVPESEMAVIRKKLEAAGLSSDHLLTPVETRDDEKGWLHKPLPSVRRN